MVLIKSNKKKKEQLAASTANKKNATLPDQIMNFIGSEVEKKLSKENTVIDEEALESLIGKNLSSLDLKKQEETISSEELERRAQSLIHQRAQELMQELEADLQAKRDAQEKELAQYTKETRASAEAQAKEILDKANTHVLNEAKKLDHARQEFAQEKKEHYQYIEELRVQALRQALEDAKPFIAETVELFKNLHIDKRELAHLIKENVATIAFDVAKQILKYEVKHNDDLLEQQILSAINKLLNTKGVMKLSLNPQDKEKQPVLNDLLKNVLDTSIRLVFSYEESVDQGSCIVETQGGRLDSSFSTQLDTIKAAFEQYLGNKISILPDDEAVEELIEEKLEEKKMTEKNTVNNKKTTLGLEPSNDELMELEENFEDFANLDIDDDLDTLLNDVFDDDDNQKKTKKVKSQAAVDMGLIDLVDSSELGANDFSSGDDWSEEEVEAKLEPDEEEFIEDLSEIKKDTEYVDEDGNKFVEYDEFAGDENFGNSGETTDERFPEY